MAHVVPEASTSDEGQDPRVPNGGIDNEQGMGVHVCLCSTPELHVVTLPGATRYPSSHASWHDPPDGSGLEQVPRNSWAAGVMVHDGSTHDMVEVIAPFTHVTSVPTVL